MNVLHKASAFGIASTFPSISPDRFLALLPGLLRMSEIGIVWPSFSTFQDLSFSRITAHVQAEPHANLTPATGHMVQFG